MGPGRRSVERAPGGRLWEQPKPRGIRPGARGTPAGLRPKEPRERRRGYKRAGLARETTLSVSPHRGLGQASNRGDGDVETLKPKRGTELILCSKPLSRPTQGRKTSAGRAPAPPTGRSPSSHTRSRLCLEPPHSSALPPQPSSSAGSLVRSSGPRPPEAARGPAISPCLCAGPVLLLPATPLHPLGLCIACLGGTPGPPLLASSTHPFRAEQPSGTRAPHLVTRAPPPQHPGSQ